MSRSTKKAGERHSTAPQQVTAPPARKAVSANQTEGPTTRSSPAGGPIFPRGKSPVGVGMDSHLIEVLHFFRLRRCPQADGVVMNIHSLIPLAVCLVRLGYHNSFNKFMDDFRRQFRQSGHFPYHLQADPARGGGVPQGGGQSPVPAGA